MHTCVYSIGPHSKHSTDQSDADLALPVCLEQSGVRTLQWRAWYVRVDFVEARERKHYEWSLPCVTARLGHAPRHQSSANDDA